MRKQLITMAHLGGDNRSPAFLRIWPDVCLAAVRLTEADRLYVGGLPEAAGTAPLAIHCLRCPHHTGPHIGPGVRSWRTERARWLRWNRRRSRFFDADICGLAEDRDEDAPGEPDRCRLPSGHDGLHTFSYHPQDLAWPFPEVIVVYDDDWHGRNSR